MRVAVIVYDGIAGQNWLSKKKKGKTNIHSKKKQGFCATVFVQTSFFKGSVQLKKAWNNLCLSQVKL